MVRIITKASETQKVSFSPAHLLKTVGGAKKSVDRSHFARGPHMWDLLVTLFVFILSLHQVKTALNNPTKLIWVRGH